MLANISILIIKWLYCYSCVCVWCRWCYINTLGHLCDPITLNASQGQRMGLQLSPLKLRALNFLEWWTKLPPSFTWTLPLTGLPVLTLIPIVYSKHSSQTDHAIPLPKIPKWLYSTQSNSHRPSRHLEVSPQSTLSRLPILPPAPLTYSLWPCMLPCHSPNTSGTPCPVSGSFHVSLLPGRFLVLISKWWAPSTLDFGFLLSKSVLGQFKITTQSPSPL